MRSQIRYRSPRPQRGGSVVMMFAIMLLALLAMAGLALDGGMVYFERTRMETAAAGAAFDGSIEIVRGNTDYNNYILPAALNDARLNGYTPDDATIVVNNPPVSGPNTGNNDFVEVIIQRAVPATFLRVVGITETQVSARAVAGVIQTSSGTPCVLALDRTLPDALIIRGTAAVDLNCGMMSNSANAGAGLRLAGNATVTSSWVGVSGGFTQSGTSGSITPEPTEGMPPYLDPLGTLAAPDGWQSWPEGYYDAAQRRVICPGGMCVFNSKLTVNGPPGPRTFDPGTYVLRDGMNIEGPNSITGDEVFFYNTGEGGGTRIAGSATVELTAPTSGPYRGVLMYTDRNAPYIANDIGRGASEFRFRGALYFPSQHLDWAGTSFGNSPHGSVIARTIDYAGTSDLVLETPPDDQAPLNVRRAMLVE